MKTDKPVACTCKDWKPGIDEINCALTMSAVHSWGHSYRGMVFRFCPWCGKRLKVRKEAECLKS